MSDSGTWGTWGTGVKSRFGAVLSVVVVATTLAWLPAAPPALASPPALPAAPPALAFPARPAALAPSAAPASATCGASGVMSVTTTMCSYTVTGTDRRPGPRR
ncbi:MAG: hypothetical protein ACRDJU_09150 [Actinomycetota bacterium]